MSAKKRPKRRKNPHARPSMRWEPGIGVIHTWPDGSFYVVNDGGRFDPSRVPGSVHKKSRVSPTGQEATPDSIHLGE